MTMRREGQVISCLHRDKALFVRDANNLTFFQERGQQAQNQNEDQDPNASPEHSPSRATDRTLVPARRNSRADQKNENPAVLGFFLVVLFLLVGILIWQGKQQVERVITSQKDVVKALKALVAELQLVQAQAQEADTGV